MSSSNSADPKPPSPAMGYPYPPPATNGAGPTPSATGTATAYPYPAPPPQTAATYYYGNPDPPPVGAPPPYYPPYPTTSYSYPSGFPFLRRLLAGAVAALIILGAATFIAWLVLRPRLPSASITSFSTSHFNLSTATSLLTADFDFDLQISNPNDKMSISYSSPSASVAFASNILADTSLPPFSQSTHNSTTVHGHVVAAGDYVGTDVSNGIADARRSNDGVVKFQVRVLSVVVFNSGGWRTRRHLLRVFCDDVGLRFGNSTASVSDAKMAGAAKECRVGI